MNNSTINQLVSKYLTSIDNTSSATSSNITASPWTTTTNIPYTISTTSTGSTNVNFPNTTYWGYDASPVADVLKTMPLILKIRNVLVDDNKIEIVFEKFSHKCNDKFLPDQGTLYFGQDIYGVYDKADYLYWEDTVKIQVENIEEALKVIKKGILFTTVNNWDEKITNEEVFLFLKNVKAYKRYAHLVLEKLLNEMDHPKSLKQKLNIHSELENSLI